MGSIRLTISNEDGNWSWRIDGNFGPGIGWETADEGSGFANFVDAHRAAARAMSAVLAPGRQT